MPCPKCDSPYGIYKSHMKKDSPTNDYKLTCYDCKFETDWITGNMPNDYESDLLWKLYGFNPHNEWEEGDFPGYFHKKGFTKEEDMLKFEKEYEMIIVSE